MLEYSLCSLPRNLFVIKEKGKSWDGKYFWETVMKGNAISFLKNPENVISVADVTFFHDKALCTKARATQKLLRKENIDFWGNNIRPGNSPDLNIGTIIKDEVETRTIRCWPESIFV